MSKVDDILGKLPLVSEWPAMSMTSMAATFGTLLTSHIDDTRSSSTLGNGLTSDVDDTLWVLIDQ